MPSDIYNAGQSNVNSAASMGKDAIGSFDPNAWASSTQGGLSNLWNQQGTTQNNYVNAYKGAIAANPTANDYYNQGMDKFNVQPLQQTANSLTNAMLTAPNSNLDAARGFNVDQNQIDQKTSQDLQRLGPAAAAAQNNATTAQNNALAYQSAGLSQNATNLLPIQEQGQYLQDAYARQQTGFTTTAQSQLDALKQKMMSGVQLSTDEMSTYASLANTEAQYQATLNTNATTLANTIQGQKYLNIPAGNNVVNTVGQGILNPGTGQVRKY